MPASTSEWDAKHRAAAGVSPAGPAGFLSELLPLLPLGPALDLACGTGRHTLLLASRKQMVTAVDSSRVALEILEQRAFDLHCAATHIKRPAQIANRWRGIQLWQADLEEVNLPAEAFSLVICVNYLSGRFFRRLKAH